MLRYLTLAIVVLAIGACKSSAPTMVVEDQQFGHRYEGTAPDGRETHIIEPAEANQEFVVHPAVFDSVLVRPQVPLDMPSEGRVVELLIKGSFPDSCTRLHAVSQERSGNIINMSLEMRRPKGQLCASVVRPYRFYVSLDGKYPPGHYTVKVNGRVRTFRIMESDS